MIFLQKTFNFKYVGFLFLLVIFVSLPKFCNAKQLGLSGTWFLYGFGLYQPLDRTVTLPGTSNKQFNNESGFSWGFGVGKDHIRLEFTPKYLEKLRFLAAVDFFPNDIVSPYIGYVYSKGLRAVDKAGVIKDYVTRGDGLVGITIQPISLINIYAEYLFIDSFFFVGFRVKLPYKVS